MSAVTKRSGSYGRTLGVGAVLVLVLATLAVVNVYTNLAPRNRVRSSRCFSRDSCVYCRSSQLRSCSWRRSSAEINRTVETLAAQARQEQGG